MDELPTQADRDAAASFFEGPCTEGLLATLFAHHRIDSNTEARRAVIAECAKVAESEQFADSHVTASNHDGDNRPEVYNTACIDIAKAIRALAKATQ